MPQDPSTLMVLGALVLGAAVLYAAVGHGGASGYLAAMALVGVAPEITKPAALVMNVLVAGPGTWRFAAAGAVPSRLLAPLVLGSIPAAFLGGLLALPTSAHRIVLGAVLLFAAARLWWPQPAERPLVPPPAPAALAALGAGLGLVSGLTGVGGGIFLSPLLLLARWQGMRGTAGASATFILVNSVSGLLGHLGAGRAVPGEIAWLGPVALAGGLYGSWLGATRLASRTMRRLLGVVLVVAGLKLLAL